MRTREEIIIDWSADRIGEDDNWVAIEGLPHILEVLLDIRSLLIASHEKENKHPDVLLAEAVEEIGDFLKSQKKKQ